MENLQRFQEHLDELNKFFSSLHNFIDVINTARVDKLAGGARTARAIINKYKMMTPEELQPKKKCQMDRIFLSALKLRGYYLVAQELAATYVDVSQKYIMPGVNQVDRLSLTEADELSEISIQRKLKAIQDFAEGAMTKIDDLANKRKKKLQDELMVKRGEAEEAPELINGAENL